MDHKDYGLTGVNGTVELGKGNAKLTGAAGSISAFATDGSTPVVIKAANPTVAADLVTLEYLEHYVLDHNATGVQYEMNNNVQNPVTGNPPFPAIGSIALVTASGGAYVINDLLIADGAGGWTVLFDSVADGDHPNWEGYTISMTFATGAGGYLADHLYMWDDQGGTWDDIGPALAATNVSKDRRADLDETAGPVAIGTTIPTGAIIKRITATVETGNEFDAGTLVISCTNPIVAALMAATETDLLTAGTYISELYVLTTGACQVSGEVTGATTGLVSIVVDFTTTP